MTKRLLAFALCLVLVLGCCLPAQADVATLDAVLSRWLKDIPSVRFSATLQIKKLLPFDESTVTMMNGVLGHIAVNANLNFGDQSSRTDAQVNLNDKTMASWSESLQNGAYTFTTSLLPKRKLTSVKQSPASLLAASADQSAESNADNAAENAIADASSAFSLLDAITDLQQCYQALTDGIKPYASEKKANYNIKGIGKGSWSRVARLTAEQSQQLLPQMRAVLACGMDKTYRAEIAQMTFDKGFVVALYRNAADQDICVYMKGNAACPDGSKRKVVFQWAFTANGLERKDSYQYSVSRTSGGSDTRTIAANASQISKSDSYSINVESGTLLKRNKTTDNAETTVRLAGNRDENGALSCKGTVGNQSTGMENDEPVTKGNEIAVDFSLTPAGSDYTLTGTAVSKTMTGKTVNTELTWTFAPGEAIANADGQGNGNMAAEPTADQSSATDMPSAGETPAVPASSLEQYAAATATEAANPAATVTPNGGAEYLVGSAPEGVITYTVPQDESTVDLDGANTDKVQSLLAEAAQNLAGKMLRAVATLPEADQAFFKDGMTDKDYAAFEALLGAL